MSVNSSGKTTNLSVSNAYQIDINQPYQVSLSIMWSQSKSYNLLSMLVAWISPLTQCEPWLSPPPPPSRYWAHSYFICVSVVSMNPAEWWKSWILESRWAGPGVKETMMLSARTLQGIKMEHQMKVRIFIIRRFSFLKSRPSRKTDVIIAEGMLTDVNQMTTQTSFSPYFRHVTYLTRDTRDIHVGHGGQGLQMVVCVFWVNYSVPVSATLLLSCRTAEYPCSMLRTPTISAAVIFFIPTHWIKVFIQAIKL